MIGRREVITLLGGAAAAWPLAARGQQRVHVVGILASQLLPPLQRFERKLREYGYIEGQNVRLVPRFAEGRDDRYPAMAVELVALPVDLIVTWGHSRATSGILVVMGVPPTFVAAGKLVWHARLLVAGTPAKSVGAARRAIC